ncbi:MAG: mechanosensitive ion channel [Gammaproteobacteria bacterium]|nr:mechanosensitive ion channel [Gammaproteobacteria bacterium]
MTKWLEIDDLKTFTIDKLFELESALVSADFWIQLLVILSVFVLARWLVTPKVKLLLVRIGTVSRLSTGINKFIVTLNEFANTLTWLAMQWIAIEIYKFLDKKHDLLTPVASLLSAWLLIRIVSKLVKNRVTARIIANIAWTVAILNIFGWLTPALEMLDSLSVTIGEVRLSPLLLIKAGLSLWLFLWLANELSTFLDRQLARSNTVTPAMRVLSVKLLHIALITIALLITISAAGIDLTALAVFGGALGVGLGFGLQKIFSNLVSGFILLMDRSIKPGDVIAIGQTYGWINHLNARYVSVITRDGIEHLIPNEVLITERVENWSFSNNLVRLKIPVGISYKSDVRQAMELCVDAAMMAPRILLKPEPRCLLKGFGDSSVDLELRVWIEDPANGRGNVLSEVLLGIWDRFHEHGIEIPYPQRDLHIRSGFEKINDIDGNPLAEDTDPAAEPAESQTTDGGEST